MNVFDLSAILTLNSSQYDQGMEKAKNKAMTFSKGFKTAMKVGVAGLAVLGAGTAVLGKKLVDGAKQTAEYGDKVDKMSQKIGISAEAYQKWDYVMQRAGTSVDSLKMGMKTLSQQAEKNSGDFQKLGISQKDVASMSKEDLFEATVKGLSKMEDGTERTVLATKLLGRAGADLAPLLNSGSEAIEEQMELAEKYGMVVPQETINASAVFEDSMTTMQMTMEGFKNRMLGQLLPAMTKVTDGLGKLFAGDMSGVDDINKGLNDFITKAGEILPKVIEVGGSIIVNLVKGIVQATPILVDGIKEVIGNAVEPLMDGFAEKMRSSAGKMIDAGLELLVNLGQGIQEALPTIAQYIPTIIGNIAGFIIENAPKILEAGINLMMSLGKGIVDSVPVLLDNLPQIFDQMKEAFTSFDWASLGKLAIKALVSGIKGAGNIVKTILGAVAKLGLKALKGGFDGAKDIASKMVKAVGKAISDGLKTVKDAVKNLAKGAMEKLKDIWDGAKDVGKNLVQGLWNGIDNAKDWIKDKISGWVGNVKDFLKNLFGIHSPSTWARDVIGLNIAKGMAEGIEDGEDIVNSAFTELMETPNIGTADMNQDLLSQFKQVQMTNNITVDGAENPEEFADRFVRQLQLQMRMA